MSNGDGIDLTLYVVQVCHAKFIKVQIDLWWFERIHTFLGIKPLHTAWVPDSASHCSG
jgi:hypothetical protein